MPRKRRIIKLRRRDWPLDALTIPDLLALQTGCWAPGTPGCALQTLADLRDAYAANRETLLSFDPEAAPLAGCWPGTRPWAFWQFDVRPADRPRPGEADIDALERLGLLSPDERRAFELLTRPTRKVIAQTFDTYRSYL